MPTPTFAFKVTATDGTVTSFTVESFEGEERVSQPFEYRLTLRHDDPSLEYGVVVNQAAVLTMEQAPHEAPSNVTTVPVAGIVASFRITRQFDDGDVECEVVLVPKLWRLGMTQGSQVFQELTTQEIVEAMLQTELDASDYEFRLSETYPTREFCMQYQESNLDFVQRLLEYDGIYYYFEGSTLVFSDDRTHEPEVDGVKQVTFGEATGAMTPTDDQVYRFVYNEQVVPQKVAVRDYDFEAFASEMEVEQETDVAMSGSTYARVGTQHEHGRYAVDNRGWTGKKSDDSDATAAATLSSDSRDTQLGRIATLRAQEHEARRQTVDGLSTASRIRPGHVFELQGHFRFDGDYLVTSVRHAFDGKDYTNTFACLPAAVQLRPPRRTPVPRVPGIMTAKVKGTAAGDPAYLDEEGRYRVQFPFDPNAPGASEPSRPIRLAQPYAGEDYGIHFPNRADTEMVFACLDGHPDHPLGLSVVPNPWKHSPVRSTDLKLGSQNPTTGSSTGSETTFGETKNVIRTQRGHQIVMDDDGGGSNVGITIQAGKAENSTGRDIYWGSKIELGGYRHLSSLERILGIISTAVSYFRNVFTRDFPGMASEALGIIASQVTTDDYVDDTFGSTTPVGVNIYTNKNVNMTGKDGVNITSPNLFGMFSSSLLGGDSDTSKNQYQAEAISKFLVNTVWQEVMDGTADELMNTKEKATKYKTKGYKNPKTQAALKWQENVKEQRVSALIFTLLQRTGVNLSSMGELKMASLQSTSIAAGQGGLAMKSFGGIEQKADLDIDVSAHQGVKISSKGIPYKGGGVIKALDKLADKVLPLKGLVSTIQTKFSNLTLDPNERFKIELENEEGDIFLHTGTGDDKGGDIMLHVEGEGELKAFANDGMVHAWSGKKGMEGGIVFEVGDRTSADENKRLATDTFDSRIRQTDKMVDAFAKENVRLSTVNYTSSDSFIEIKKGDQIELKCGQSSIVMKKNGDITIKGKNILIDGKSGRGNVDIKGTKVTADALSELGLKGMNIKLDASVNGQMQAGMLDLKGQGIAKLGAALTQLG